MADPLAPQDLPPEWRGILRDGERILWQGGPQRAFHWKSHYLMPFLGAAAAAVFALIAVGPEDAWLTQILVAGFIAVAVWAPIWDAFKRRYSFYTLTDQRAFTGVAAPFMQRELQSHPINRDTELFLVDGSGRFAAVYYAHQLRRRQDRTDRIDIGFESLSLIEAERVHKLIRELVEADAARAQG